MADIYEFCGKPGAGKTLICRELLAATKEKFKNRSVVGLFSSEAGDLNILVKAFSVIHFLLFDYRRFLVFFHHARKSLSSVRMYRKFVIFVNAIHLDFRLSNAVKRNDIILIDQGFLQLCWSNTDDHNIEDMKCFLLDLYMPYRNHGINLVHIETSSNLFAKNITFRQDIRGIELAKYEAHGRDCLGDLVKCVSQHGRILFTDFYNDTEGVVNLSSLGCMVKNIT